MAARPGLCSPDAMRPAHQVHALAGSRGAYTLTEVLVVCAIIGILVSMMVPSVTKVIHNGRRTRCTGNLRQVSLILHSFANEHRDRYPHQLPKSEGGVREDNELVPVAEGVLALHPGVFKVMAPDFRTHQVLVCPATKFWLNRVEDAVVTNTSYAVNLHAEHGEAGSPLLADANVAKQWKELKSFPLTAADVDMGFTFERHQGICNVSFGDSHVESRKRIRIQRPAQTPARPTRPVRTGPTGTPAY